MHAYIHTYIYIYICTHTCTSYTLLENHIRAHNPNQDNF